MPPGDDGQTQLRYALKSLLIHVPLSASKHPSTSWAWPRQKPAHLPRLGARLAPKPVSRFGQGIASVRLGRQAARPGQYPGTQVRPGQAPGPSPEPRPEARAKQCLFADLGNAQMKKKRLEMEGDSWKGRNATDENARKFLQKDK